MCQLTFIDIKSPEYLPQDFSRLLITSNAYENNYDGFGFYLYDEKVIRKTSEDAIKYFNNPKNRKHWDNITNPLGIYHVRRASIKTKELKDEHAHPFYEHNTVLAHNGTLTMKYHDKAMFENNWKHDGENLIDSQFLLRTLNAIRRNEVLTADHIEKAVNCFTGTYALLIHDTMVKNSLWIARGDGQKTLWKLVIMRNKHPVGMVINTKVYMLNMLIHNLLTFSPTSRGLSFDVEMLKEQQIYNYEPGTFKLNEVKSTEKYKVATYAKQGTKKSDNKVDNKTVPQLPNPVVAPNIFAELIEYTLGLGLSFMKVYSMIISLLQLKMRLNIY
jgi:predicted glutamine amidotransferase